MTTYAVHARSQKHRNERGSAGGSVRLFQTIINAQTLATGVAAVMELEAPDPGTVPPGYDTESALSTIDYNFVDPDGGSQLIVAGNAIVAPRDCWAEATARINVSKTGASTAGGWVFAILFNDDRFDMVPQTTNDPATDERTFTVKPVVRQVVAGDVIWFWARYDALSSTGFVNDGNVLVKWLPL